MTWQKTIRVHAFATIGRYRREAIYTEIRFSGVRRKRWMVQELDFLDLEGWVTIARQAVGESDIEVTARLAVPRSTCPHCGVVGELNRVGTRRRVFRDVPRGDARVGIAVNHQRYICKACGKVSTDTLPEMDTKRNMSLRLLAYIERRMLADRFTHVADEVGLDEKTIRIVFHDWRHRQEADHRVLAPRVLGMDEVKLAGHVRGILIDVEYRTVLDLLKDRQVGTVASAITALDSWQDIQVVTADMWKPYRQVVRNLLPQAAFVVDKFHVLRMANAALEIVRKAPAGRLDDTRRRKLMRERYLLLRRPYALNDSQRLRLDVWLGGLPLLKEAYEAKEGFFRIYDAQTRADAEGLYTVWERNLSPTIRLAFSDLITSMINWRQEIFAYFDERVTNAATESMNAVARSIDRIGHGLSFEAIRAKLLYQTKHKTLSPSQRRARFGVRPMYATEPQAVSEQVIDIGVDLIDLIVAEMRDGPYTSDGDWADGGEYTSKVIERVRGGKP